MRHRDDAADDARADDFRCPGCETPTMTGRYCDACRAEDEARLERQRRLSPSALAEKTERPR